MNEAKAEKERLEEDARRARNWKRWGPYLSERQWGTVREDYSPDGSTWDYLPHDHARSRAYRWGEDGLLGITDRECRLCFGLALWNGRDPILKERLFGLTGPGRFMNLKEVAGELSARLARLFLPDPRGHRPCHGGEARFAADPHWKDLVLFYEYFHGDTGRGVGASHQTGWTALAVRLLEDLARSRQTSARAGQGARP